MSATPSRATRDARTLADEVAGVLAADSCSGCGACCLLDPGLSMALDERGYLRPTWTGGDAPGDREGAARTFRAVCPGVAESAPRTAGARRHPTMGPVVSAWQAWARDPDERHRGSSGGALTALAAWLAETGVASQVLGARADPARPDRTVSVPITSREEALGAAGSRYAPVATAADPAVRSATGAVVAKPCEAAAVRALHAAEGRPPAQQPLLLSFYCAGTPSQHATRGLLKHLGVADEPLRDLWYRGRGWPGAFTATTARATVASPYEESWGRHLGPTIQWRCKLCVDGVGEHADVTAADYWRTDARGYPTFAEGAGVSALIARTPRGHEVLRAAERAGVLHLAPLDVDDLAAVQPSQTRRRRMLAARLLGARLAGRRVPRYRGFGLARLALREPREALRTARSTYRRARAATRALAPVGAGRG